MKHAIYKIHAKKGSKHDTVRKSWKSIQNVCALK